MVMTFLISCIMVPLMLSYSKFSALENFPGYTINQYTMGNVGGASSFCAHAKFETMMSALSIDCPNETLIAKLDTIADNTQKPVYEVGIIASTTEDKTFCSNSALGDDNFCKDLIDRTELDKFLTTDCVGKQSC